MTPEIKVAGLTITVEEVQIADIPPLKKRPTKWQPLLDDLSKRLEVTNGTYALRYDFPTASAASSFLQAVRKSGLQVTSKTRVFDGCTALFISHAGRKPYKGGGK